MVTCEEKRRGWERGRGIYSSKDPGLGPSGHITLTAQTWTQDVQQRTMSSFRFQARYALLTYAQCGDLDPFAVVNHLAELGAECIIGRENHSDGGLHLHAFVDFGRKYRTRNTRAFDVEGCHPNVSPSRGKPEEGYDYAIKDGDVVAGGLERPGGGRVDATSGVWAEIVNAKDEPEFWSLCESLAPRALVTTNHTTPSFRRLEVPPIRVPYETPSGVNIDTSWVAELDRWVRDNLKSSQTGSKLSCTSPDLAAPKGAFWEHLPKGDPSPLSSEARGR